MWGVIFKWVVKKYAFIYGLFSNVVSIPDYVASSGDVEVRRRIQIRVSVPTLPWRA
jgi:hypothetical protein